MAQGIFKKLSDIDFVEAYGDKHIFVGILVFFVFIVAVVGFGVIFDKKETLKYAPILAVLFAIAIVFLNMSFNAMIALRKEIPKKK